MHSGRRLRLSRARRLAVSVGAAVLATGWLAWIDAAPAWGPFPAPASKLAALPQPAFEVATPAEPAVQVPATGAATFQPVQAIWTIDDCPDGDNHAVQVPKQRQVEDYIRAFRRHHVGAGQVVFFMTGVCYRAYPELVAEIHASGYLIGNHTSTHANLALTPDPKAEIDGGPHESRYFRPPYGAHNAAVDSLIARLGLVLLEWDVTAADSGWGGLANSCDSILQSLLRLAPVRGRLPVVDLHMYNPLSPTAVDAYLSGRTGCDGLEPPPARRATA